MDENPDIPDEERGLYTKYEINHINDIEGKHTNCFHFVLDLDHDEFAEIALWAYVNACQDKYPKLADDLHVMISKKRAKRMQDELSMMQLHPEEQADEDFLTESGE